MRTAQARKSAEKLLDSELTPQQKRFVAEYLIDQNATAAAERAGYSDASYGRQLLTLPHVAQAIAQQQRDSLVRTLVSADEVLEKMWQLATFDANEISQYRRGCCRYCWGFGHHYQWRDVIEFEEREAEAKAKKGKNRTMLADMATTTTAILILIALAAMAMELAGRISLTQPNYPQ